MTSTELLHLRPPRPGRRLRDVFLALALALTLLAGCPPGASAEDGRLSGVALVLPVPGSLLRGFEPPLFKYGPGHHGVDLAAGSGDPVRAGAAGVVTFAGMVAGRGVVTIDHGGGVDTTYEPVVARVGRGDRVAAGAVVGIVGSGSHVEGLHWGLRRNGAYFDPMQHLGTASAGPIRLLPLAAQPVPLAAALAPPASGGAVGASGGVPVSGPVTSGFGMRLHPVLKVWKLHDGVDFGAPCGAPIRSVAAGTVVGLDRHRAYGNWVIVDIGGGRRHGYTHLGSFGVQPGQQVDAGSYLGAVGSTGYSTGCHLHFMAWQGGRVVPPW